MRILKKIVYILQVIIILTFLSQNAFAICLSEPTFVKITSGSKVVGEFGTNENIFIKPNLKTDPLKIEFVFENNDDNCFSDKSDMNMKLFNSGVEVEADSFTNKLEEGKFISTFIFNFEIEFDITSSFTSVFNVNNGEDNVGSLNFNIDTSPPIFNSFSFSPKNKLLKAGDTVTLDYEIEDSESGLEIITETTTSSNIITFDNSEKTFSGSIVQTLNSGNKISVRAVDKLGQETIQEVVFDVDQNGPDITNLKDTYSFDTSQKVSFEVRVSDESFAKVASTPKVTGDFSDINPILKTVNGVCAKETDSEFICVFDNLIIENQETTSSKIEISATDALGNENVKVFDQSVFVDNSGPEILSFRTINSKGVENVISSDDDNIKVELKFRDESISKTEEPRIIERFGEIPIVNQKCEYNGDIGECTWDLEDSVSVYNNFEKETTTFEIAIIDFYSNTVTDSVIVKVDNELPILKEVRIVEKTSIKDSILTSNEEVDFEIIVSDDNLFSNEFFIFADFSNIDFRDGKENVKGSCSSFDEESHICTFNNIVVENGFFKKEVIFKISDTAGNEIDEPFEVEVFSVSDEVVSSYKIGSIQTTNPINRNQILDNTVNAWFEGEIELKGDPNLVIINYQLVSCESSDIDPLIAIDFSLFPDEIVINNGQENLEEFALKVELKDHPNVNDLNQKKMSCSISILKRDDTQIFKPEIVEFELVFGFFDIPRGDLLEAHAESLLDMIEQTEYLGGYFDSIYEVYSLFSGVCELLSSGTGVLTSVDSVWRNVGFLISSESLGTFANAEGEIAKSISNSREGMASTLQDKLGPVKKMCDWVTCRNGAHLTGLISDGLGFEDSDLGQAFNDLQNGFNSICSGDFESIEKTPERIFNSNK